MSKIEHLQIKIESLAEEARIIKSHERKRLGQARRCLKGQRSDYANTHYSQYQGLREHRIRAVRREIRDSLIAYAFIRGRSYRNAEPINKKGKEAPRWRNVIDIIGRFSNKFKPLLRDPGGDPAAAAINEVFAWRGNPSVEDNPP